jgi:hypothetical protein
LPQWWKDALTGVHCFIILPLSVGNRPSGFIYCDWNDGPAPIRHDHAQFALLNKMRALLVKSFEMRQMQGVTPGSKTA